MIPNMSAAEPGDMLVTAMPDGTFQIARVPTNGRADHVLGYQRTQVAALRVAWSATSGAQRVFLRGIDTDTYALADAT